MDERGFRGTGCRYWHIGYWSIGYGYRAIRHWLQGTGYRALSNHFGLASRS